MSRAASNFFRVVQVIDVLIALVVVAFFLIGLVDGSVSSFNIGLWLLILVAAAAILFGSQALHTSGRTGLAIALALLPALPVLFAFIVFLILIATGVQWH
jgi:hypothetical protein